MEGKDRGRRGRWRGRTEVKELGRWRGRTEVGGGDGGKDSGRSEGDGGEGQR